MIAGIKAEFRKIFSIRSTFVLLGLAFIYLLFYDFYIIGFKGGMNTGALNLLRDHAYLITEVTRAGGIAAPVLFSSIIAVLIIANEYRYNTIMYTLTASNSRHKTLLAKLITVSGFALLYGLVLMVLAPSLALLGIHIHHLALAHQVFYYRDYLWRIFFFTWAYAMLGLLLALLLRNVVATVVSLFLIPLAIEPLIGLLLNMNQQQYLPFTALTAVLNNGFLRTSPGLISAERSALVVLVYLIIGWVVGWLMFIRRDAS